MPDNTLLELHGAHADTRHTPLATIKFIGGLQTQRSPFASIDTRYNSKFLGGKPDALIDGSNCEISNSLTLQRRFGLTNYGPAIPAPLTFFEWKSSAPPGLQTVVDTPTAVYTYSPTFSGILFYKTPGSGQTNFWSVVNTLYTGNGVDLYKVSGPNLLLQSNTFSDGAWSPRSNATVLNNLQFDPNGGLTAYQINWLGTGPGTFIQQSVFPNYTPIALNTFTASIWIRASSGTPTVTLYLQNQAGTSVTSNTVTLSQTWTRYSVTGSLAADSTRVVFRLGNPSAVGSIQVYAAQLEVGGPMTPAQITTTQPQGVYLWGIVAPTTAPVVTQVVLSAYWQATHAYLLNDTITDSNGNLETVTVPGTSGGTAPTWSLLKGATTTDGGVTWVNGGPNGLSPKTGYRWYYAYLNQYTGHPSNVSPISTSTAVFSNNLGIQYNITGVGSNDPQVNQIALYRNVDGGAFWLQVAVFGNPPNGIWTYGDVIQDVNLSSIYAPIGLLNSPPPIGAINPVWHQSRMWVSVSSNQYFSSGPDNASVLNIVQNGVVAESFAPANVEPLDEPIVRSWPTTSGILTWTVGDLWLTTGSDLASFNPVKILAGHGVRNYNAIDSDGSTTWMYTSDKQFLSVNASAGSVELGFTIGDVLAQKIDPSKACVARHISGSLDNAVFVGDSSTGWYRVNPNQVGASVSGEPSPVFSPFATLTGGAQVFSSIETSPGVKQLLVGAVGTASIQTVGQLTGLGSNSGSGTPWSSPNNISLNSSGSPATVTLAASTSSQFLQATNFNLGVPNDNITGIKVFVVGSQSSADPNAVVSLSWISPPSGPAPTYTFQLPLASGQLTFGGVNSTWGQVLTAANLNSPSFGFQIKAANATGGNVTFNVSGILVQVFYFNSLPTTFNVQFRDITVFADAGVPYTWNATIGSLYLASSGTLAEPETITTIVRAANGVQPAVAVLLDEITGPFETLSLSVNDPPQLAPSTSLIANRFHLSQGSVPPLCQHMQIKLSGGATATRDELLALIVRGALVPEQS